MYSNGCVQRRSLGESVLISRWCRCRLPLPPPVSQSRRRISCVVGWMKIVPTTRWSRGWGVSEPNSQDVMGDQLATQRLTLLYASRARHVGPMVDESTRDARAACAGEDWLGLARIGEDWPVATDGQQHDRVTGEIMTGRQGDDRIARLQSLGCVNDVLTQTSAGNSSLKFSSLAMKTAAIDH
jgi:hypothetical protein